MDDWVSKKTGRKIGSYDVVFYEDGMDDISKTVKCTNKIRKERFCFDSVEGIDEMIEFLETLKTMALQEDRLS